MTPNHTSTPPRLSVFAPQYRAITLSTLLLLSLAAFDGMSVVAALPGIGADLGVAGLPLVLTVFSLTATVALLASGPLIDSLGLRRTYRFTLIEFGVASVLCAVAPNLPTLIVARALQGIGGGTVLSISLSNTGLTYPPELRPRAVATSSMVWGIMALGGPAAAALLLSVVSWRGIFLLHVPLVAVAGMIGWRRMPDSERPPHVDIDPPGIALIAVVMGVLLAALSAPGWLGVGGVAIAVGLATVFWRHSGRAASPVVDRRHLAAWPFGPLNLIPCLLFAGALAVDAYVPILVRGALGRSNTQAAFAVAAFAIGWTLGSNTASRLLDRWASERVTVLGFATTLPAGIVLVAVVSEHMPYALLLALSVLQGSGMGMITNSVVSRIQRAAAAEEMGRASATHQFMREVGGTLGIAAAGAIVFGVASSRLGGDEQVRSLLDGGDIALDLGARQAIAAGYRWAAVLAVALNAGALAIALYVRRRTSVTRPSTGVAESPE